MDGHQAEWLDLRGKLKAPSCIGRDDKIVVVPEDDRNTGNAITSLADLPKQKIAQIEHHFTHYKDLKKPGSTVVKSWGDVEEAKVIIHESIERWNVK